MTLDRFEVRKSAVLAALLLFMGCASQAPPSGGPPDRTPPRIVSTIPSNGSVTVGTDSTIDVLFSESMDRKSVERAVFLSPRPAEEPHYQWEGRRLRINLKDGLSKDRTYRVSIGSDSKDEYRNQMHHSHDFTFSTGFTISKGEVSGKLDGPVGRSVFVVAFNLAETADADPTGLAPYVTQAGLDGVYSFPGLEIGTYRLFAFEDTDQDQTFDLGEEWLAIASEDAQLTEAGMKLQLSTMRVVDRDTAVPSAVAAQSINNRRIRLKMSEPVRLPTQVTVIGKESLSVNHVYHDGRDSSVVFLVTGIQSEGEEYSVTVSGLSDAAGNVAGRDKALIVKGDGRVDTRAPTIVASGPRSGNQVRNRAALVLTFDEAMQKDSFRGLWIESDSTSAPVGAAFWLTPNVWQFTPDDPWGEGDIMLKLNRDIFRDLAENVLEKSVDFKFEVVGSGQLGRLTGKVIRDRDPIVIEAVGLEEKRRLSARVAPDDTVFVLEAIMPGNYSISGFVDLNDDGSWFHGTIQPYAHAEPLLSQADTVEVRSRWETVTEKIFSRYPVPAQTTGKGDEP